MIDSSSPGVRALFASGGLLLALFVAGIVAGSGAHPFFGVWVFAALHLNAIALLAWRAALGGPGRGVAIGFGAAVCAWLAGWIHHFIFLQGVEEPAFPSASDALWLLFFPASFAALLALVHGSMPRVLQRRLWTDGFLLTIVLAAIAIAVLLEPLTAATGGDTAAVLTNLAYPLGDVLLISMLLAGAGARGWRWSAMQRVVGVVLLMAIAADVAWMALNAAGLYERGTLLDAGYAAVALGLALAAWTRDGEPQPARPWNRLLLTAVTAGLAIALLAWGTLHPIPPVTTLLALLTLAGCTIRGLAIARQVEALKRSRDEALVAASSDELTGLGNRRALRAALSVVIEQQTPASLALFNLRRLDQTNLESGTQAGDERVLALARTLTDAAADHGASAHRIDGAVLALLLPGVPGWAAFTRAQEMATEATGPVAAGVATLEPGMDAADLIRRADRALVEARRSQRGTIMWSPDVDPTDLSAEAERHDRTLATALARAVDAKDSYTRSHSETVAECCVMIGRRMGLSPHRLARLRVAGLLHDVGKIGIPDAILQKPGPLDPEEWEVMHSHSRLGADIVLGAELEEQADWILHHHERLDGSGYPDGLAGKAIPLESRIIHVADAFEAMTADRPYRRGRPAEQAAEELRRHAGTQFDPDCVEALCGALAGTGSPVAAASTPEVPPSTPMPVVVEISQTTPRRVPEPGLPRVPRLVLGVLGVFAAVSAVRLAVTPGAVDSALDTWIYNAIIIACGLVALSSGAARRRSRAGLLLGLGLVCWGSGNVVYTALDAAGEVPIPSPADPLYLLFDVFAFVAVGIVVARALRRQGLGVWLDGMIVALGAMAVLAATVLNPALSGTEGRTIETLTTLAYPLGDVLLLGVLATMTTVGAARRGRAWSWLVLGTISFLISDIQYLTQVAAGTYVTGGPVDVGWLLAAPCFARAAWMPTAAASPDFEERRAQIAAAAVFGVVALVLLLVDHFAPLNAFAVWLAFATGLAVVARTVHAFRDRQRLLRDSRREALTDALTGLANRRALLTALDGRLQGEAIEPSVLVLFDLDGFKGYNDTFGHPAGDALLVRLGTKLAAAVPPGGRAFRMGGDEFCALVPLGEQGDPRRIATNLAAALQERGSGFSIGASWGDARLPDEAGDAARALRVADDRLYERKRSRRATALGAQERVRRPGPHTSAGPVRR